MIGLCVGCSKEGAEKKEQSIESGTIHVTEHSDPAGDENNDSEANDTVEIDFTRDYAGYGRK